MERRQLSYFLAVVDHGSFTAAAKALYVAQPSLSQAIRLLEDDLGAELFHRLHRGVRLTSAGEALLAPARQALRDLETARTAVDAVSGLTSGRLDLSMLPALAMDPIATVVGVFRRRYPGVSLAIRQPEEARVVVDHVRSGVAEIGFLDSVEGITDLDVEEVVPQELVAVLPPGTEPPPGPLGWDELLRRGLICGTVGTLVRDLVSAWATSKGLPARPAIELGRRESGIHFVVAGAGVAVMPSALAEIAAARGAVLHPIAEPHVRMVWMVTRPGALSPSALALRTALRQSLHATATQHP